MTPKPIVPREQAVRDIDEAVDDYLRAAGETAARGFLTALERAWRRIAHFPANGTFRHPHELDLPGLRSWPLQRYLWLVFLVQRKDQIPSGVSCMPTAISLP